MTESAGPHGEFLTIDERVVVAPSVGVFRPACITAGAHIHEGDVVGELVGHQSRVPVHSLFDGTFMGMLAIEGERCRRGQPVAWLRREAE